jgi:hypothetical protein
LTYTPLFRALPIWLTALLWFPHCYDRNLLLGYDFPIYYLAGQGVFVPGWAYADPVAYLFWPLSLLPYPLAYAVWYGLLTGAWYSLAKRLPLWLAVLSLYPGLLALETSNVTLLLAWACLTPLGAVLASLVKPYLAVFVALHAYGLWLRDRGRSPQEPPHLPPRPVRGL